VSLARRKKRLGHGTGTAAGKAFLDMLGVFAEFETNIRKERQLEGTQKAKGDVHKGRPAKLAGQHDAQVADMKAANADDFP
jgi:DNA invertase Pin-like site-specific DNA recombinase